MAGSTIHSQCALLPGPRGLLSMFHSQLEYNCGALDKATTKGRIQVGSRSEAAFNDLKCALTTASVLQLLNFDINFIVECDAFDTGFGAVLHQGSGPVAFYSKKIVLRHAKLVAYERELIGLVNVVCHWRPYLWGSSFVVCTNHYSLKFLLDQKLATVLQHQWASKLLGFDFYVEVQTRNNQCGG
jgi:hypothetical protein